jgi:hypothetical protein
LPVFLSYEFLNNAFISFYPYMLLPVGHHATNPKVVGSIPNESSDFSIDLILPATPWTWG